MYIPEYIVKNHEEVLTASTFNVPDGAILSMFTLMDLDNILPEDRYISFQDAVENHIELHGMNKMGLLLPVPLTRMLDQASKVRRYRRLKVHDCYNYISDDDVTQSAIVQIDLKDNTTIVVFAGTDDTIVGWREDYRLVYGEVQPCLKHALEYVETRLSKDRKYIFVGHSKGGYESLYAGLMAKNIQDNIIAIYSYDGPGYPDALNEELKRSPAISKAHLIAPNGAVVAGLFKHPIKPEALYSNEKGVNTHNPLSWRIKNNDFDYIKPELYRVDNTAVVVTNVGDAFSYEYLKELEDSIFSILYAGGSEKLSDIPSHLAEASNAFIKLPLAMKRQYLKLVAYFIDGKLITRKLLTTRTIMKKPQ